MEYYCERFDTLAPEFPDYKGVFKSDADAIKFFQGKHGSQLECVYDEDFNMVWEANPGEERLVVRLTA